MNPYQLDREHPEQEMRNLGSIDEVSLDDSSSEEELDHDERLVGSELNQKEETSDLGATFDNQTDQMAKHLLGSHPYIIENKSLSNNRLLHDFLNMEQQLHWRALLICSMVVEEEYREENSDQIILTYKTPKEEDEEKT